MKNAPDCCIGIGVRVLTFRSGEALEQARVPAREIDPGTWRIARLVVGEGTDHQVDVTLLRSSDWLELHGIAAGKMVELYLPEMGVKGPAFVHSVEACPEIEQGDEDQSRVVTATFRAKLGVPWMLRVDGVDEAIRVTGDHHVWSDDRISWVRVDELEPGEHVRLDDEPRRIVLIESGTETEEVFDLEVEACPAIEVGDDDQSRVVTATFRAKLGVPWTLAWMVWRNRSG